jgi:hypothetical protein
VGNAMQVRLAEYVSTSRDPACRAILLCVESFGVRRASRLAAHRRAEADRGADRQAHCSRREAAFRHTGSRP